MESLAKRNAVLGRTSASAQRVSESLERAKAENSTHGKEGSSGNEGSSGSGREGSVGRGGGTSKGADFEGSGTVGYSLKVHFSSEGNYFFLNIFR